MSKSYAMITLNASEESLTPSCYEQSYVHKVGKSAPIADADECSGLLLTNSDTQAKDPTRLTVRAQKARATTMAYNNTLKIQAKWTSPVTTRVRDI